MHTYGLIGRTLAHSFSPRYFAQKFEREGIADAEYRAFELPRIEDFPALLQARHRLAGLNVTIPYKEQIIPYLDRLSAEAQAIGAVNTIAFEGDELVGHNTDAEGFRASLTPHLMAAQRQQPALILGTGGASKAVAYVLGELGMAFSFVSRTPQEGQLNYADVTPECLQTVGLIVNTTPLGTHPDIKKCPTLPYSALGPKHLLYDLIYNPAETLFMRQGRNQGATAVNGWNMLRLQAEAAWRTWNCSL